MLNDDDFSFEDYTEKLSPVMKNLKEILKTIDIKTLVELFDNLISFIKFVDISRDTLIEELEMFKKSKNNE